MTTKSQLQQEKLYSVQKDLKELTKKIGKKRDELRAILTDVEALVDSVQEADLGLDEVTDNLQQAVRALDRETIEKLSYYA